MYQMKYKSYPHLTVCFKFSLLLSSDSLQGSQLWCFSSALLMSPPGGGVEAGDHHDVGLAETEPVLQSSRHHLKGLQMLQGVHLEGLPQVDWGGTASGQWVKKHT